MKETNNTKEEMVIIPIEVMKKLSDKFLSCCKRNNISINYTLPKYEEEVELTLTLQELEENLDEILLNKKLKRLSISDGEASLDIFNQLVSISQIEELCICNYESFSVLKRTLLLLADFKNLKRLTIHNSYNLKRLPEEICKLLKLVELRVFFTGIEQLPHNIGQLTNLYYLEVACNKLKSLPESIKNLKKLETLIIDDELTHEVDFLTKNMPNLKEIQNMDRNFENMINKS